MKFITKLMLMTKMRWCVIKRYTTTVFVISLILMFSIGTQNVLGDDNEDENWHINYWVGTINSVDIVVHHFGQDPNDDALYVNLSYGGTTSNGYYKFVLFYEVQDRDGANVDDEHVIFQTKWYYGVLCGGGGGGGGGGIPMSQNSFNELTLIDWRPVDGEMGEPINVFVGAPFFGVSFELMRLFSWSVERAESEDSVGPVVYLNQTSGWLIGSDYDYRNGANAIFSEPNVNSNGIIWGVKLYFKITILVDDDDIPGGYGGSYVWNYPVGLLVY